MPKILPSGNDKSKDSFECKMSAAEKSTDNKEVNMVKLESMDGKIFDVEEKVVRKFILPEFSNDVDQPIRLDMVPSDVLTIMIKWAERHVDDIVPPDSPRISSFRPTTFEGMRCSDLDEWDDELLIPDALMLSRIIRALDFYRQMEELKITCLKKIANMIKGKTPEELRKTFDIRHRV